MQLADALSPVSKKKTGRAYVALARAHSEKYVPTLLLASCCLPICLTHWLHHIIGAIYKLLWTSTVRQRIMCRIM